MSTFSVILLIVGFGLLALGGFSGYAIFARALKISDKFGDETNVASSNSRFLLKAHGYQAYEQDKKICNRTIERLFLIPDSRFKRLQSWPNPFKKIVHT